MEFLVEIGDKAALGFATALSFNNLLYCGVGVFLGMLLGVIPGIGTLAAMSLLFPLTFHLDPTAALVMLAGIYYGTAYGGSVTSILLNLPGTPAGAVACLEGHPMAKSGRAGVALMMTAVASFGGASIGIVLMMLSTPVIVDAALQFGPAEYFSLMAAGLVIAATTGGSPLKGLAMICVGILFGLVGLDVYTGAERFTFSSVHLYEGISIVALAMGLFGVSEIVASIGPSERNPGKVRSVTLREMMPTRGDVKASWAPILRGSAIGSFFGALPGTGGTVASFVSYAVEKKWSKTPERFGTGAIEGIVSPEASNNAADQTAFIPTMALGIPGTASLGMILGVLMIHGYTPGPSLMTEAPEMFWGLIMSFWIGNLMLLILNIPLVGVWVSLLRTPYQYLYPTVLMFICLGTYSVSNSVTEIFFVILFGVLGYGFRLLGFTLAPLLLGFILGPLLEENFRRAMLYSRGDLATFVESPISATFLALSAIVLVASIVLSSGSPAAGRLRRLLRM